MSELLLIQYSNMTVRSVRKHVLVSLDRGTLEASSLAACCLALLVLLLRGNIPPTALEEENVLLLHTTTAVVRGTFTVVKFSSKISIHSFICVDNGHSTNPVPIQYVSGTYLVPIRYQSGTNPVPIRYQSGTNPVPIQILSLMIGKNDNVKIVTPKRQGL